jgi:GNAT superfamily N-acetyltransferase
LVKLASIFSRALCRLPSGINVSINQFPPPSRNSATFAELAYRVARRLTRIEIGQVLRLDLASVAPPPLPPLELEYRFLNDKDVRAAAVDPSHELGASIAQRLQSGRDFCFAAYHGDRLANYSWFALDAIEPEHSFGAGLKLPPDTVYLYKAYTMPDYRGRQIHGAALSRAAEHFRQRGLTQMIAIVDFANWASLRSHTKLGFRPAGRLFWIGRRSIGWGCGALLRQ